ncbi:unnamed protein product [Heterobilharzia americana]|nr:unnamed protein product [Heterobilharzia americana]
MDEKQMAEHGPSRRLVSQLQAKEEEDLAQAIALSLKDTSSSVSSNLNPRPISSSNEISSLYPRSQLLFDSTSSFLTSSNTSKPVNHPSKGYVRAVYDFEAAEDNELTFKAGDIILLLDDSDENWWLGSCNNNKGLFPAQFVKREKDMDETKILQSNFNEVNQKTNVKNELNNIKIIPKLDERKIDECLRLITTVDPTGEFCQDPPELRQLEAECLAMLPLVDPELKSVDKKLIMLTELNQRLLDAFQLYHNIMSHQNAATAYYAGVSNANLMKSYLPNSVNVFPYSQPISMPGVYVPSNLPTIPANGSNVPAESNGSMMVPPSDTYSVQSGIYANPQTDNCSGNILQNVQAHAVPQFTLQPFYGPNQAVSDVTQQMQSYPSVSNHYGISTYSITEPKVNVYPDQQSMHTPQ